MYIYIYIVKFLVHWHVISYRCHTSPDRDSAGRLWAYQTEFGSGASAEAPYQGRYRPSLVGCCLFFRLPRERGWWLWWRRSSTTRGATWWRSPTFLRKSLASLAIKAGELGLQAAALRFGDLAISACGGEHCLQRLPWCCNQCWSSCSTAKPLTAEHDVEPTSWTSWMRLQQDRGRYHSKSIDVRYRRGGSQMTRRIHSAHTSTGWDCGIA